MHDHWETLSEVSGSRVRRMPVPGGWLYQVESIQKSRTISAEFPDYEIVRVGWSQPIFVAGRSVAATARRDSRADSLSVTRLRSAWTGSVGAPALRRTLRRAADRTTEAIRLCWSRIKREIARIWRSM